MNRKALLGVFFVLAAASASAEIQPQRINFQGKLINPSTNNPQTGPVSLTFNLYNVPVGGSSLYTETQSNVPLTNGVFSVEIGTINAISRDLFLGASVYLGVTVVGDLGGEMVPRQDLVMSAYAFSANQLSDNTEVRLIAGITYSTFTNAGNLTVPGGVTGSSGTFSSGITASSGTFLATGSGQYALALSTSITFAQSATGIGIRWGDGTISTTAANGGGASAGETNTYTSSKTFTNNVQIDSPSQLIASSATFTYGITAATGTFTSGVTAATGTITGNAFSVGGSTLVISGGNVGMGTSASTARFFIRGENLTQNLMEFHRSDTDGLVGAISAYGDPAFATYAASYYNDQTDAAFGASNDATTGVYFPGASGGILGFTTSSSEKMRIQSNGYVGIGTTGPASKLHISSGTLMIDGTGGAINIAVGSVTASAFFGDGSHLTGIPSTASITGSFVNITGDGMTGNLTMLSGSTITITGSGFSVGTSSFAVAGGSATVAYSMTAKAFYGDGTNLTNVVNNTGDSMTGPLTMASGSTITISGSGFSVGTSSFVVAGGSATVGYSLTAKSLVATSSVTASAFFGDGTNLTNVVNNSGDSMSGPLTMISGSTITISGSGFSVGASSFSVAGGSATVAYSMTATAFYGNGSNMTGTGRLIGSPTIFTSNGTYTKATNNPTYIVVEAIGGGGGGGGVPATKVAGAGGGGGGGYSASMILASALTASETVTVSSGAAGGTTGKTGGAADATSFGTLVIANGGAGGTEIAGDAVGEAAGGAGGVAGTGNVTLVGNPGGPGLNVVAATIAIGGAGGAAARGGGGGASQGVVLAAGTAGLDYGGGGGGSVNNAATGETGGAGAPGIVIVWEYK